MVTSLEAVILGIIQGITEWLPISSSGHLAIYQNIFGVEVSAAFDIFLHLGSILVILFYFRKDLIGILKSIFYGKFQSKESKLVFYVFIASIPAGVVGFLFLDFFESLFRNLFVIGLAMIFNALILFSTKTKASYGQINAKKSFFVGMGQMLSIIPGISRSGSTISFGILSDIKKEDAFKLSFIMAIPALVVANLVEIGELSKMKENIYVLFLGMLTSAFVGFMSINMLFNIVRKNKLHLFGYYSFIIGMIVIFYTLFLH